MTNAAGRRQTNALLLVMLLPSAIAAGNGVAIAGDPAADGNSPASISTPDASASIVALNVDQMLIAEAIALGFIVKADQKQLGESQSLVRLVPPSGMDRMAAMLSLQRRFPTTKFSFAE